MPGKLDIDVYIGDSWPAGPPGSEHLVTVNSGPSGGPFTPLALTGTTVTAAIRRDKDDQAAVANFTVDLKDQVANPGEIGLVLPVPQSDLLENFTYYWDLEVSWNADTKLTVLAGYVRATKDVSP